MRACGPDSLGGRRQACGLAQVSVARGGTAHLRPVRALHSHLWVHPPGAHLEGRVQGPWRTSAKRAVLALLRAAGLVFMAPFFFFFFFYNFMTFGLMSVLMIFAALSS